MGPPKLGFVTLCLLSICLVAAAARTQQEEHDLIRSVAAAADADQTSNKQLNTYYFDVSKPQVALSSRVSSRPERTAVTVKLSEVSVSTFMPVVNPQASGMTHSVSNTWKALKNLATMFSHVNPINSQNPDAPRLFPRAAVAVKAASDNAPGNPLDVSTTIKVAEATDKLSSWAEVTPSSVLLLPYGQSTGAVADVMDVTYDAKTNEITLDLDIVHHPHTVSEFEPHAKQTLDVDEAHYHFDTAPGVMVNAQALLNNLKTNGVAIDGAHIFMKGIPIAICDLCGPQCDQCGPTCFYSTLTADKTVAAAGAEVEIKLTILDFIDGCFCATSCASEACCRAAFGSDNVCCDDPTGEGCNLIAESGQCTLQNATSGKQPSSSKQAGDLTPKQTNAKAESPRTSNPTNSTPARGRKSRSGWPTPTQKRAFGGIRVSLTVVGDAEWVIVPDSQSTDKAPHVRRQQTGSNTPANVLAFITTDSQGVAKAVLKVGTGAGPISVIVTFIDTNTPAFPSAVFINAQSGATVQNPVAKLKLIPTKGYRHCGDPITLTALAVDANNLPVPNAKVAFSVVGDCHPTTDKSIKTTDANGIATVTLMSHKPGVASVVAAGVDANGGPVLSDASHIFYYVDRHHADERERAYFRGDHERYAKSAGQAAQEMVKKTTSLSPN